MPEMYDLLVQLPDADISLAKSGERPACDCLSCINPRPIYPCLLEEEN